MLHLSNVPDNHSRRLWYLCPVSTGSKVPFAPYGGDSLGKGCAPLWEVNTMPSCCLLPGVVDRACAESICAPTGLSVQLGSLTIYVVRVVNLVVVRFTMSVGLSQLRFTCLYNRDVHTHTVPLKWVSPHHTGYVHKQPRYFVTKYRTSF